MIFCYSNLSSEDYKHLQYNLNYLLLVFALELNQLNLLVLSLMIT